MLSSDLLLAVCLAYVATLFALAFLVDRRARQGRDAWLRSPIVYTLSISVYCTAWTFYGAVGAAARSGLEFITIYLGPTLVFVGWWWLLRKLVRIARQYRITSIADLISSRYGKSSGLAVLVTLMAVMATTPYIALQLQSLTRSYQVIVSDADSASTAIVIAIGLTLFTVLFGTRNLDANERHHGVVAAIAVEAVVKLVALIAVGTFAVYGVSGGFGEAFAKVPLEVVHGPGELFDARWLALLMLSACAIVCLPRQFHVTVVENVDERHLATASWLFPLYLFGMCVFVMPIALAGLAVLPEGSNPDLFVLTLPLALDRHELALLAFLGGFSSATSMVIVAAIAVSTMVSNHIVMPIAMQVLPRDRGVSGDVRKLLLNSRRVSIAGVLGLGLLYFHLSGGSGALAAIGLIAFAGVAQFMPSLVGGLFWRGATRAGAMAGLLAGFALWGYTLFLPGIAGDLPFVRELIASGPFGIEWLRPRALLGLDGLDPLVHALVWSLGANVLAFLVVSTASEARPLEHLQGALFVDIFRAAPGELAHVSSGPTRAEDLFVLAQRILGVTAARALFDDMAREQGLDNALPSPSDAVIARVERVLAGSIGAPSAHAMVSRVVGRQSVSIDELIDIADETQRLIETSRQLALKSDELERAARQLREANERLRLLDSQKDDFLGQVSHELRTPMTSIRSFSEILLADDETTPEERRRFLSIIHDESLRLTRLLDELLDISRLEKGSVSIPLAPVDAGATVRSALDIVLGDLRKGGVRLRHDAAPGVRYVQANEDRLRQVLLNLLTNAMKYNAVASPEIRVRTAVHGRWLHVDVIDNGGGISRADASAVFEKFNRGSRGDQAGGAGLGLTISRAVMRTMGGDLTVEFVDDDTSFFRVRLLLVPAPAAASAAD